MATMLTSIYLVMLSKVQEFMEEKRGDEMSAFLIRTLIVIVGGVIIVGGIRILFPNIWTIITDRITNLFNPTP